MGTWEVRLSDPGRVRRARLAFLLAILLIPVAFYSGTLWQAHNTQAVVAEHQPMQARILELEAELDEVRQRLTVVGSGKNVAQQANEQNRLTIK